MALQKTVTFENGLPNVANAYCRIDGIYGNKNNLSFILNSYVSQAIFADSGAYIKTQQFEFVPSVTVGSANFIEQGYAYLKTLPEYAAAVDC